MTVAPIVQAEETQPLLSDAAVDGIIEGTAWYDPTYIPCGATSGPSTTPDRGTRYSAAWAFFIGKGLSEEATAGIMGNLEAESGINPHNMQNSAPLGDGPEFPTEAGPNGSPVPHSAIRGLFGYGIAQWTSANRQQGLIDFARATSRSTGDLSLQLDYLWKELSEKYTGVLAVLQTPGVSLVDASYTVLAEFETPRPFTPGGTEAEKQSETANRQAKSQSIYDEFKGSVGGDAAGTTGCASGGPIDLTNPDTTNIPCTNGTQDVGVADGYRRGQLIKIRLCAVRGGVRVNSQLAGSIQQMLNDNSQITINNSFRNMQTQISVYYGWCARRGITPTPPPYPRPLNEYRRCPGAAPPGYSNHQQGMALDLGCNGTLIPMDYSSASNNDCFLWLQSNGIKYNLYEFSKGESRGSSGYEGWHWSVDGN